MDNVDLFRILFFQLSNLRFPADFNMPTTIAQARSVFNVSPSDIIDLD